MAEEKGQLNSAPWYRREAFPLVPILSLKKADEYNTSGFVFTWMGLQLWTLDSVEFELSIVMNEHWGVGFMGILPYLRWVLTIPMPTIMSLWIKRHLYRRANNNKNLY